MQKLLEILNDIKPGVDFSTQTGLVDSGILTSIHWEEIAIILY